MYLEYFDKFYDMAPYLHINKEEWRIHLEMLLLRA